MGCIAISTRETQLSAAQVVQQLGGGSVVVVTPPGQGGEGFPETVSAKPSKQQPPPVLEGTRLEVCFAC